MNEIKVGNVTVVIKEVNKPSERALSQASAKVNQVMLRKEIE